MKPMHTHRKPAPGFTLIEMMVVILITAIFLALAVPSYKSFITQDRMASEINDISTDVQLARSAAVKQGVPVTICSVANPAPSPPACSKSANWQTGWMIFTDVIGTNAPNQTYQAGDQLIRLHPALQGSDTLVGSSSNGAIPSITFNRIGGTSTFVGTATVQPGSATYGWLTLTDSSNNPAWLRCVAMSEVGTNSINTATSNPGGTTEICP